MSRLELIEELSGKGAVSRADGELVGEYPYVLAVYQEMHDTRSGEVPGLKQVEGWVEEIDIFGLLTEPLTLHIDDGRQFDFFIYDANGSISARSRKGIQQPDD